MVGPAQLLVLQAQGAGSLPACTGARGAAAATGVVQPPSNLPAARRNAAAPATELGAEAAAHSTGPRDLIINCKLQIPKHQKASPDTTPVLTNALQAQQ